jgi:hypothetical protein
MTTQFPKLHFLVDDDLPRFPMPAEDAMDSAQARRFIKSINEGSATPSEPLKSLVKTA